MLYEKKNILIIGNSMFCFLNQSSLMKANIFDFFLNKELYIYFSSFKQMEKRNALKLRKLIHPRFVYAINPY